jgi:hypothetical protein
MNVNVRAHISQQLLCLVTAGGHGAARRDPSRVFRVAPRARPRARRRERERAEARVARASFSRKWAETGGLSTMARTRVYITPHRIAPTDARKTATRDPECAHARAHAIATRRRRDGMHCHLKLLHPRRNVRRRATAACGVFDAVPFAVRSRATLAAPAATSHGQRLARQAPRWARSRCRLRLRRQRYCRRGRWPKPAPSTVRAVPAAGRLKH